jgi:hypothetical protein
VPVDGALSTVSAVLLRVGLGSSRLEPPEPPNLYLDATALAMHRTAACRRGCCTNRRVCGNGVSAVHQVVGFSGVYSQIRKKSDRSRPEICSLRAMNSSVVAVPYL